MVALSFNANNVAPSAPMELLPPGEYVVQIVNSEMRQTKDGGGSYLWLEMDILDGEFTNRKIWDRLNLENSNPTTVDVAYRTLSAICHATGVVNMNDSEDLHTRPMIAVVKVQPPKGQYDASNQIKGYKPLDQQTQQQPTRVASAPRHSAPPPAARQAAAPAGGAPWRRQ